MRILLSKKMYRKKASITVEAVFIVPIVLMITMTLIFAVMSAHDRGIIYMELARYTEDICFNCNTLPEEDNPDTTDINKRLLLYTIKEATGKKEGSSLHVTAYADSRIRKLLVFDSISTLSSYSVDIKGKKNNICKKVRKELKLIE